MDKKGMKELLKAHLEAFPPECRWCFAIDRERITGKEIGRYDSPDAMVLHYSCPRCGGEYSAYIPMIGNEYVEQRMRHLHPEIEEIDEERLDEAFLWSFPEDLPDAPRKKTYTAEMLCPADKLPT